jgi:hypothetical protein
MKVIHSNQNGYQFYPLDRSFLAALNLLGDQIFGADYLLQIGLEDDWEKIAQVINPISFCVVKGGGICAARISYPPGSMVALVCLQKISPGAVADRPRSRCLFQVEHGSPCAQAPRAR